LVISSEIHHIVVKFGQFH